MKIYSLTKHNFELKTFEIEISLMPGLPQISILGQADHLVKESIPKIRSAIKSQGFKLPKAQQILVDLKPQSLKKSNYGLELAIATAILQETKQVKLYSPAKKPFLIVGNLSLKGEAVKTQEYLDQFASLKDFELLTPRATDLKVAHSEVQNLKDLNCPSWVEGSVQKLPMGQVIQLPRWQFPQSAARLIEIVSTGEHPCLLAGPVGSGKSTVISVIPKLLEPPDENARAEIEKIQSYFKGKQFDVSKRPEVNLHHSISPMAFIGGGSTKIFAGEITRAHRGTLIMDEFMEFNSEIQEALREPLENGKLTIARNGNFVELPAEVCLLATSNLCFCGQFSMNSKVTCRCAQQRLKTYLARLNGPCLDRLHILAFSSSWEGEAKDIDLETIHARTKKAIDYRIQKRGQKFPNSKMSLEDLSLTINHSFVEEYFKLEFLSERRQLSLKRVARTIADLEESERVRIQHFSEALKLTVSSFRWIDLVNRGLAGI